jgi:hypothetical protein
MEVVCQQCGQKFQAQRSTRKWCSTRCRSRANSKYQRVALRTVPCAVCGQVFQSNQPRKVYCSKQCALKASNARRDPAPGRARSLSKYWQMRHEIFTRLDGQCIVCGANDRRVLQLNHKHGGGGGDNRAGRGGVYLLRRLLSGERDLGDFDLRCANCNILYEYEMGRRTYQEL